VISETNRGSTVSRRQPSGASRPAASTSTPLRVGVWGHYYGANLGDELVTSLIIHAIRARRPNAYIHGFSLDPFDTQRRHGIPASPIRSRHAVGTHRGEATAPTGVRVARGIARRSLSLFQEIPHLWRSYRLLKALELDLLVVAGSGQLTDAWQGAWGHPYTIYKWAFLARITHTPLAFVSVGAGPLEGWLARLFVRSALAAAAYVSVRDQYTLGLLRTIGVSRPIEMRPDSAFAIEEPPSPPRKVGTVVGVNAMAHADVRYWGRSGSDRRYAAYVGALGRFVHTVLDQGGTVLLFSSQTDADTITANDIVAELVAAGAPMDRVEAPPVSSVDELLAVMARCDYVVASRFHCAVLALRLGIPTIALSYQAKTTALMTRLGQGDYCLDIDAIDAGSLSARLAALQLHQSEVVSSLARHVRALHAEALGQFDLLFGHVQEAAAPGSSGPAEDANKPQSAA
jgi:polysaccharide pyruvyl transferase WcaK-like protein